MLDLVSNYVNLTMQETDIRHSIRKYLYMSQAALHENYIHRLGKLDRIPELNPNSGGLGETVVASGEPRAIRSQLAFHRQVSSIPSGARRLEPT